MEFLIKRIDTSLNDLNEGAFFIRLGKSALRGICLIFALLSVLSAALVLYSVFTGKGSLFELLLLLGAGIFQLIQAVILFRVAEIRSRELMQLGTSGKYTVLRVGAHLWRTYGEVSAILMVMAAPLTLIASISTFTAIAKMVSQGPSLGGIQALFQVGSALAGFLAPFFLVLGAIINLITSYIIAAILNAIDDIATSSLSMARHAKGEQVGA